MSRYIKKKDRKKETPEKSGDFVKKTKEELEETIKADLKQDTQEILRDQETKPATKTIKKTQVVNQIEDNQEYVQEINGERLVFQFTNGKLELKERTILSSTGPRYFRLRPLSMRVSKYQKNKRYFYNMGPGKRNLRFWQENFEGVKRDPKKEKVELVEDEDVIRALSSMPGIFEQVHDYKPKAEDK